MKINNTICFLMKYSYLIILWEHLTAISDTRIWTYMPPDPTQDSYPLTLPLNSKEEALNFTCGH